MAILITWNPKQGRWHDMPKASLLTLSGKSYEDWWGVRSKSAKIGTRLFLMKQGDGKRGIVGSGWAASVPRPREKPEPGRINQIIDATFDLLLDPDRGYPPLDCRTFKAEILKKVHWTTQSSGISVPDELDAEWRQHVKKTLGYLPSLLNEDELDLEEFDNPEGPASYRLHRKIERNKQLVKDAKAKAKQDGRFYCWVCSFDFAAVYGERGDGFIEAHHTIPVSQIGQNYTTRIADMAMVCSNCHRMLHQTPLFTVDRLRKLVANNR
jgi:HNH endonuclease